MDNRKIGYHISGQFNKELQDIHHKVLTMGGLVEQQIALAVQAFTTGDMEAADQVIRRDNEVDNQQMEIDLECTQILALRQPAACDLRLLLTVIKVINELEVVGDLAERIARMAVHVSDNERKSVPYFALQQMADLVKGMMHDALDSFARMNIDGITRIIGLDDRVDHEYGSSIKQLITQMKEDPRNIARTLNVLSTVRALEKIGDYVCYICHHVIYMIKGEDVRHLTQQELELRMNQLMVCN